jgi:hypothetical protein
MAAGNPQWGDCRRGGVFLRLPQPSSPLVVHTLSRRVPSRRRRWNEVTKSWWIHDSHIDLVEEILRANYPAYDPFGD